MEWLQNIPQFIAPAFILSIVVYLVRFFGKIIADQKPFSDNRNWEIEISGINFFLGLILLPSILGVFAALSWGELGSGHWTRYIIVSICGSWLWFTMNLLVESVYKIKAPVIRTFFTLSTLGEGNFEKFSKNTLRFNNYIPLLIFPTIFAYILTLEYRAGNLWWVVIMGVQVFVGLIFAALNYSLRRLQLPQINIFFVNNTDPVKNVILLKINDDNVRIKNGEQVTIINRDQIKKIEFVVLENSEDS